MVSGVRNTVSKPTTIPTAPKTGMLAQAPAATAEVTAQVCMAIFAFKALLFIFLPTTGRGVKFGRRRKLTQQQITHARKMIDAGERREVVAALLNASRTALYRALAIC